MKFILPIKAVVNAQKCVPNKEVRYYLEGFHVTKSAVEATNGHYMYRAALNKIEMPDYLPDWRSSFELPESMIIKMKQKIKLPPKSSGCEFVIFEVSGSKVIATTIDQFGGEIGVFLGAVIDGKFPDSKRVIPSEEPEAYTQIGFNSEYLKKAHEVLDGSVRMKTYGEHKAAAFEAVSFERLFDASFILMPIRL